MAIPCTINDPMEADTEPAVEARWHARRAHAKLKPVDDGRVDDQEEQALSGKL